MARPLRTVTVERLAQINLALDRLKAARDLLRSAGAKNARAYVAAALKSAQGARNHAARCLWSMERAR